MKELFSKFGIELTDENVEKFKKYYNFLIDYNKKVNLTAIVDEEQVMVKHFLDSALAIFEIPENASIIDIGSGAGFPGVPLKILRPDVKITLVDSLAKRTTFLQKLCDELNIEATIIHSRAEDLARTNYREKFDVVVARAVSPLVTLAEYTLPFVKKGGILVAFKGANAKTEINSALFAISMMGGYFVKENIVELPENVGTRSLIIIKKAINTPIEYPRGNNLPKLKPLVK